MIDGVMVEFYSMMSGGWAIGTFLNNLNSHLRGWGQAIVSIIGVIMVVVGVFNIGKGLMSGGRSQTNWVLNIVLFFLGGALAFTGGWSLVEAVSKGGADTLNEIGSDAGGGTGTAIMFMKDNIMSFLSSLKP